MTAARKSSRRTTSRTDASTAVTVAVLGTSRRSAISPKPSPGLVEDRGPAARRRRPGTGRARSRSTRRPRSPWRMAARGRGRRPSQRAFRATASRAGGSSGDEDRIAPDHRELALRDAGPAVDPAQAAPADEDRDREQHAGERQGLDDPDRTARTGTRIDPSDMPNRKNAFEHRRGRDRGPHPASSAGGSSDRRRRPPPNPSPAMTMRNGAVVPVPRPPPSPRGPSPHRRDGERQGRCQPTPSDEANADGATKHRPDARARPVRIAGARCARSVAPRGRGGRTGRQAPR